MLLLLLTALLGSSQAELRRRSPWQGCLLCGRRCQGNGYDDEGVRVERKGLRPKHYVLLFCYHKVVSSTFISQRLIKDNVSVVGPKRLSDEFEDNLRVQRLPIISCVV